MIVAHFRIVTIALVIAILAGDPPIMLMDEPFGAIDPINREHLQNEFLKIQEKVQKTIVFVTHDIDEAIKMGDKICLLEAGRLVQFDTPENMLVHPKNDFVRSFVGGDRTLKRLNLFTVQRAMRPDPPTVLQSAAIDEARNRIEGTGVRFGVVTDNDGRYAGMLDLESIRPGTDTVHEAMETTQAWLTPSDSLKDGLSEIFTHDCGFLVVVAEDLSVIVWLTADDIKNTLKG